jgi:hypothetical protein
VLPLLLLPLVPGFVGSLTEPNAGAIAAPVMAAVKVRPITIRLSVRFAERKSFQVSWSSRERLQAVYVCIPRYVFLVSSDQIGGGAGWIIGSLPSFMCCPDKYRSMRVECYLAPIQTLRIDRCTAGS